MPFFHALNNHIRTQAEGRENYLITPTLSIGKQL